MIDGARNDFYRARKGVYRARKGVYTTRYSVYTMCDGGVKQIAHRVHKDAAGRPSPARQIETRRHCNCRDTIAFPKATSERGTISLRFFRPGRDPLPEG